MLNKLNVYPTYKGVWNGDVEECRLNRFYEAIYIKDGQNEFLYDIVNDTTDVIRNGKNINFMLSQNELNKINDNARNIFNENRNSLVGQWGPKPYSEESSYKILLIGFCFFFGFILLFQMLGNCLNSR